MSPQDRRPSAFLCSRRPSPPSVTTLVRPAAFWASTLSAGRVFQCLSQGLVRRRPSGDIQRMNSLFKVPPHPHLFYFEIMFRIFNLK